MAGRRGAVSRPSSDPCGSPRSQEVEMLASVKSAVLFGARGHPVTVEVHVAKGLPGFHIVGLPDESIREARDRVRAAV
ncbi:MAG: magnesium chelatase domain-containing protein, partial [Ilumatobacteraceae bacterium]